jgi:small subunit ribosomal protein S1
VLDENIQAGTKVKGRIVNIEDYGAFLEITPGVEGLIHISEVSWSNQPINSKEFFKVGEDHEAMVVTIDREDRKMSLSLKQLTPDPWQEVATKYPVGSRHSGLVKNLTPYGVFVELDENIGGMVHISDLSWIKRFQHPKEYTKVGENLDTVILDIDHDGRKISLGHKQIEEDPWDTFESVFPTGSVHDATVLRREDKGAIVALPYGLEGFVPNRHLKKENDKLADVDEVLPFKVIEFDRDDKRIVVSHTRFLRDKDRGGDVAPEKESGGEKKQQRRPSSGATLKKVNKKVEKSTFGELDALAKLKQQMEATEATGAVAGAAAAAAAADEATEEPAAEAAPEAPAEEPAAEAAPEAPAEEPAAEAAPEAPAAEESAPEAPEADEAGEEEAKEG